MDTVIQQPPGQELETNNRISILNAEIDVLTMRQAIDLAECYVHSKQPLHIVGVNADKINQMHRDPCFRQIVNRCGIIHADGISVVLASRFLKKPLPDRVAGIDFMEGLVALAAEKEYSVFLLGATQHVVERTWHVLQNRYAELHIAGIHNGYFDETDWPQISRILMDAEPDIVFVGISSPQKEFLISYLQSKGHNCVFMGVGGSFDVLSGAKRRAPLWVQKIYMEWFFRMLQEPRRLLKRYLVGNVLFLNSVCKEKIEQLRQEI